MKCILRSVLFYILFADQSAFANQGVPLGFKSIISYYENYTNGEYSRQLYELSLILWDKQNLTDPKVILTGEMSRIFSVCSHLTENECHKYLHRSKPRKIQIYAHPEGFLPDFTLDNSDKNGFGFDVIQINVPLNEYLTFDYDKKVFRPSLSTDLTPTIDNERTKRENLFSKFKRFGSSITSVFTSCFSVENVVNTDENQLNVHHDIDCTFQPSISAITTPFHDEF